MAGMQGESGRKPARRNHALRLSFASAALLAISACSVSSVMSVRPQVDVGTHTASLPAPMPVAPTPPAAVPASAPAIAIAPAPADMPVIAQANTSALAPVYDESAVAPGTVTAATPATMAAVAPAQMPAAMPDAPPSTQEPALAPTAAPAAPDPNAKGLQKLVPSNPMMVSYPRFTVPRQTKAAMPAEEIACRRRLRRLGVTFTELEPINDGGACRIDNPIKVSALSGGIEMSPAATLNCQMAETFARWTKKELAPAARIRYLSGIKKIRQGSAYSCRRIAGTSVASEHSKGNALDVMSIVLNNGKDIDVRRPGFFAFREKGLLNAVRAEGCDYFTTVLGPGYNADHADHFHFDLKSRRSGYRACK